MIQIVQNTATIEFNVFLTLSGAAATGKSKPTMYFVRPTDTSRTAITAGLITWSEIGGGLYHVKIADDGTLTGLLTKTLGELLFMVDALASNYDLACRVLDVISIDVKNTALSEDAAGLPPATPTMAQEIDYIYRELVKNKSSYDGTTEKVYLPDGSTVKYKRAISTSGLDTNRGASAAP